ncbi:MAG TPA: sorbosone dehydrogenase family protein [Armatimonadota bacterium]|nr:sorbosone dehydrogenase family protein [Armatimonadota bacterium]
MRRLILFLVTILLMAVPGCTGKSGPPASQDSGFKNSNLLKLPPGFRIGLFASSLDGPRMMALSPDGRLFVTEMGAGRVTILPDANGDHHADSHIVYASGLNNPHGIAFHGGYLYVADEGRVIRYPYRSGDNKAPKSQVVVPNLPTGGEHITRTITFGPADGKLYVSVGSSCNACIKKDPLRASIIRCNADGSGRETFATGLRNSVGLAWNPRTSELWATDNGRDYLGDDLPPDEVNVIRQDGFYGWPYAYGNRIPDPAFDNKYPQKVADSILPKIAIQAHSAPLGLIFYTGSMFPAEYRGNLFIAYHGSWNRTIPTGYKVVRFAVQDGEVGGQQDFITGWLQNGGSWGRPVSLLVGKSGELYITDDKGGQVYVVTYGS